NSVLLREKFRVTYSLITQFHFENINRHNDCLIHNRFSLFINAEIIQPQNIKGFCNPDSTFLSRQDKSQNSRIPGQIPRGSYPFISLPTPFRRLHESSHLSRSTSCSGR